MIEIVSVFFMNWLFRPLVMLTVIAWHELGHLLAARMFGIGVQEFSIGVGPRLGGFRIGATRYTLRLLPIGGYVDPADWGDVEDKAELAALAPVEQALVKDPRNWLANKPLLVRQLLFLAGPGFNLGLAAVLFGLVGLSPDWTGGPIDFVQALWHAPTRGEMLGFDYGPSVSALNHFAWIEDSWRHGSAAFLRHFALLNLLLGLLNLLPLPPLDGAQVIKEFAHELHHGPLKGGKLREARRLASVIWGLLSLCGLAVFVAIQFL